MTNLIKIDLVSKQSNIYLLFSEFREQQAHVVQHIFENMRAVLQEHAVESKKRAIERQFLNSIYLKFFKNIALKAL
jgi:2,3-bisphosphoglycerate-independent phosphoglycerate mutase